MEVLFTEKEKEKKEGVIVYDPQMWFIFSYLIVWTTGYIFLDLVK